MSAVGDARKRLDESTARPESGEETGDGVIVEPVGQVIAVALDWLARRDEKRDREAVGRVVERVRALADSWQKHPGLGTSTEVWLMAADELAAVLTSPLAEIEGA